MLGRSGDLTLGRGGDFTLGRGGDFTLGRSGDFTLGRGGDFTHLERKPSEISETLDRAALLQLSEI